MIVVCKCGQLNRVKAALATGAVTAKEVNCGKCKQSLRETMQVQVDRNSDIVLAIVALFQKAHDEEMPFEDTDLVAIFANHGMDLLAESDEDESDSDDDEDQDDDSDDEDEDEEEEPKKKKAVKKKPEPKAKKKKKPVGRDVH